MAREKNRHLFHHRFLLRTVHLLRRQLPGGSSQLRQVVRGCSGRGQPETGNFHSETCREFLLWTISMPGERNSSDPVEKILIFSRRRAQHRFRHSRFQKPRRRLGQIRPFGFLFSKFCIERNLPRKVLGNEHGNVWKHKGGETQSCPHGRPDAGRYGETAGDRDTEHRSPPSQGRKFSLKKSSNCMERPSPFPASLQKTLRQGRYSGTNPFRDQGALL